MRFQPLVSHAPGYDPEHVAALGEAQHEPRAEALGRRPEVLEDEADQETITWFHRSKGEM